MSINVTLTTTTQFEVAYLRVSAEVRYWEDATINGQEDEDGSLVPLRNGDLWEPTIDLEIGKVLDWPEGTTADIHFKVCDAGEYWLQDPNRNDVAKWGGHYVPDAFLCVNDRGYGDYIILKIGADGFIEGWRPPFIDSDEWTALSPSISEPSCVNKEKAE